MTRVSRKGLEYTTAVLGVLGFAISLHAQTAIGTWVQQSTKSAGPGLTMTVEACCNGGRRLIYRLNGGDGRILLTVESPMDGRDVPVLAAGKPTGETMGIKLVDDHHAVTVLKMNGKPFGTSKATLSADGKTLTIENDITADGGGQAIGKQTEIWLKK